MQALVIRMQNHQNSCGNVEKNTTEDLRESPELEEELSLVPIANATKRNIESSTSQ